MRKYFMVGFAGLFLLSGSGLAACGSDNSTTDASVKETITPETTVQESAFPVTVGDLTLAAQPTRIVSLSPTHTETLFAIGAGDQVVAVDDYSNYPTEAVTLGTKLSGFEPNVEAIAGYSPDLVVIAYDPGGFVDQLKALDIPVYIGFAATSLDDVYMQIEQLGALTGHLDAAVQLTGQMQTDIETAVAQAGALSEPLSYYYELDPTYYSVTSNTFIGQIFSMFGLQNIADTADAGNDYPQLSSEVIVSSNPSFIMLADTKCCGQTPETVAARDGWAQLDAVKNGNVIQLDDDIASRWGPRVVELVNSIREAISLATATK